MNNYPNSIWNNMVKTTPIDTDNYQAEDYKVEILSEPDNDRNYKMDRNSSSKMGQVIVIGSLVIALMAAAAYVSYRQEQSRIENTAVAQTMELSEDATLNITVNPVYSFIETSDGRRVGEYNGINARELALEMTSTSKTK